MRQRRSITRTSDRTDTAMLKAATITVALVCAMSACGSSGDTTGGGTVTVTQTTYSGQADGGGTVEGGEQATVGKPFVNFGFKTTVTGIDFGVTELPASPPSHHIYRPKNGQFVVVHVTAQNVGTEPDSFSTDSSTVVDSQGRSFAATPFLGLAHQQLGPFNMQPESEGKGMLIFDVPTSVTSLQSVIVQPDPYLATNNPVTVVAVS